MDLSIYPALEHQPAAIGGVATLRTIKGGHGMSSYRISLPPFGPAYKRSWVAKNKYAVDIHRQPLPKHVADLWLNLDYQADTAMLFENGELVADTFYLGRPWMLGLKRFLKDGAANLLFYFRPLEQGQSFMPDLHEAGVSEVGPDTKLISVSAATVVPEYRAQLTFE